MAWELFKETKGKFASRASVSPAGFIGVTKGASLQFGLNKNNDRYAELYYDSERKYIGVKFQKESNEHTVKVMFREDMGFSLSAKGFLNFYKILPEKTNFYSIKKEEETGIIIIDLNSAKERKVSVKS